MPQIFLYADSGTIFRPVTITAKLPAPTPSVFGLEHCFQTRKRQESEEIAERMVPNRNGPELYNSADSNDAPTTDDDVEPVVEVGKRALDR